jgi:hypothetical protein
MFKWNIIKILVFINIRFQLSQLLLIVSVTKIVKVFILDIGIWFEFFLAYKNLVHNKSS